MTKKGQKRGKFEFRTLGGSPLPPPLGMAPRKSNFLGPLKPVEALDTPGLALAPSSCTDRHGRPTPADRQPLGGNPILGQGATIVQNKGESDVAIS